MERHGTTTIRNYIECKDGVIVALYYNKIDGYVGISYGGEYKVLWTIDPLSCCIGDETREKYIEIRDWVLDNGLSTIFDQEW